MSKMAHILSPVRRPLPNVVDDLTEFLDPKNWDGDRPRQHLSQNAAREALKLLVNQGAQQDLLSSRLEEAQQIARECWAKGHPAPLAAVLLVRAVRQYLASATNVDISALGILLVDLEAIQADVERSDCLFFAQVARQERAGRPTQSRYDTLRQQISAVSISILMDSGLGQEEAIHFVRKRLRMVGFEVRRGTLRSWRAKTMACLQNYGSPGKADGPRPSDPPLEAQTYVRAWSAWGSNRRTELARDLVAEMISAFRPFCAQNES